MPRDTMYFLPDIQSYIHRFIKFFVDIIHKNTKPADFEVVFFFFPIPMERNVDLSLNHQKQEVLIIKI